MRVKTHLQFFGFAIAGLSFVLMFLTPVAGIAVTFTQGVKGNSSATITGSLSKGSGTFVIDHPQDPKNKLLFHSFVESPDVLNIYDGIISIDKNGEAIVQLPEYFEALNKDFQYLVRPIDAPAPNLYIKEGVKNNKFKISGGVPNEEVSWQVTGIRHDPFILANPIVTEVRKSSDSLVDQGEYIYPEYYKYKNIFQRVKYFWKQIINVT
jgi:hypothetical protein